MTKTKQAILKKHNRKVKIKSRPTFTLAELLLTAFASVLFWELSDMITSLIINLIS